MTLRRTVLCLTCVAIAVLLFIAVTTIIEGPVAANASSGQVASPTALSPQRAGTLTPSVYVPLVTYHEVIVPPVWVTAALINGGFEANWDEAPSHDVIIVDTDGTTTEDTRDNILTPPGWVTWFRQGLAHVEDNGDKTYWGQPEAYAVRHTNPDRMHSGTQGQMLYTVWRIHDAGFLQQIEVITGQQVRLNGWGHAWSNNEGAPPAPLPNPDNPYWSEGSHVGFNQFHALEGTEGLDGGDMNFLLRLGIDPTGGRDPGADTVVWGAGAHIYNGFWPVPEITATAEAPTITVFLRSTTLWRFKHNNVYWDDIQLEVLP